MSRFRAYFASFGTVLLALLPQVFCPAYWPAYAGVLCALGLGFIDYTPYLLPVILVFLIVALWGLYYGAAERKGYSPLILGGLASIGILLGKFVLHLDSVVYVSVLLFCMAPIWNAWPGRARACPI